MKNINQKQKEFNDLMEKQDKTKKDEADKNKKLSYEDQKAVDAAGFKD